MEDDPLMITRWIMWNPMEPFKLDSVTTRNRGVMISPVFSFSLDRERVLD